MGRVLNVGTSTITKLMTSNMIRITRIIQDVTLDRNGNGDNKKVAST